MNRARGLDSIRFICAFWVCLGHSAAPAFSDPFEHGSYWSLALRGFYNNLWNGPAAVIVFFIISGFCIHFPFAGPDRTPVLKVFYTRRFLRLLIPVAVVIPVASFLNVRLGLFEESILWSLLAEMIYYACYPALRMVQIRMGGWTWILAGSFCVAFAVVLTSPHAGNYPSYGPALNWLLGLPCWLLGCDLAERTRGKTITPPSAGAIRAWRASVCAAAWLCSVLRFHSPVGFPWTLNIFAVLAAAWLYREIGYRQVVAPLRVLEWAGTWSYSLYLMHLPAMVAFAGFHPASGPVVKWFLMRLFPFACSYVFYLVVERPAHVLARNVSAMLQSTGDRSWNFKVSP